MVERSGQYILKDQLPDRYSFRFWSHSLDDQTRRAAAEVATNLILRWIKEELHKNVCSKAEVEELLQWIRLRESFFGADDPLRKSVNLDALPANTINHLCSVLFGAQKPIENKIWERWFSSLNVAIWLPDCSLCDSIVLLR